MSVLLDTHVWVWWLTKSLRLKARERNALNELASRRELSVAAISLWELQMLHQKGRLELPMAFRDWIEQAADPANVTVLPLDVPTILTLDAMPSRFRGDPADRLIVATARARRLLVATRDARIRRSRLVRLWRP